VAGCCECGDEPSGSCATELVGSTYFVCHTRTHGTHCARTKYVPIVLPALMEEMSSLGGYDG
jgi:hypothetical protein